MSVAYIYKESYWAYFYVLATAHKIFVVLYGQCTPGKFDSRERECWYVC